MKIPALILAGSLAANAALVAVYFSSGPALTPAAPTNLPAAGATPLSVQPAAPPAPAGASSTLAADPKTWTQLRSGDLRALAARLREAGFPPLLIRAVITAQVNDSLRAKFEEAFAQIEQKPFWATDTGFGGGIDPKTLALFREMNRETNRLLLEALGPDFPAEPEYVKNQQHRFGNLSPEKVEQLQRVTEDYDDLRQQTTAAARGLMLPEDREKLALLEKEKRADLAKILSPSELEDYLMRTSQTTMQLRTALTAFNASESEFRAIYQAKAAFDEKYSFQNMGNFVGGDRAKERTAAQAQVTEQLKAALGEARYAEYTRSSDREYQAITRITQQANLPATAAVQAYDLRAAASKESNRIFADTALTTDQKRAALATLAQNTRTQLTATLGAEVGSTYLKVANFWLRGIEQGAVIFTENGVSFRSLPMARPANATPPPATPVAPKTGG